VELLTVVGCLTALLAVAVPSVVALSTSIRLGSTSNEVLAGILRTRSEAIRRNARVSMCKSADGESCTGAGGWEQGWIMFVDADDDGARSSGELLLHKQASFSGDLRLTGNAAVARYISYVGSGYSKLAGGGFLAGTLTLCSASAGPSDGRQIILNSMGRPRVQKVVVPICP
jgi:type IV fimbrial biogenesis protein FimT